MIQRIQSIYLFLAAVLLLLTAFLPVAQLLRGGYLHNIYLSGLLDEETGLMEQNLWLPTLAFLSAFTAVATIFLYKDRSRQMRIVRLNIFISTLTAMAVPITVHYIKADELDVLAFKVPVVFPVVSTILMVLAYRGIKKDDNLVRSADRLR